MYPQVVVFGGVAPGPGRSPDQYLSGPVCDYGGPGMRNDG